MSTYTMKNILNKYIRHDISILYACPDNFKEPEIITELNKLNNVSITYINKISNLSWFSYDLILTHQINEQIMSLAYQMHCPVICVVYEDIDPNESLVNPNDKNIEFIPKETTIEQIVSTVSNLKHKRFIL